MLPAILNQLVALSAMSIALRFGQKPERFGGLIILLMIIVSDSRILIGYSTYKSVDLISLSCDVVGFVGFSTVGVLYNRVWPLWAAALQLLSVGAHFVRALEIPVRPIVYAWMKGGPTWAVYILLIIGSLLACRQSRAQDSMLYSAN